MKHCSINQLDDFDFHDSVLENGHIIGDTLTASLRDLNIHSDTPQNTSEFDMTIELAQITFEGVRDLTAGNHFCREISADGTVTDIESVIHDGDDARKLLIEILEENPILFSLYQPSSGLCAIDTCYGNTISFSFARVILEWDNYSGKAWYESDEWRQYRQQWQEKSESEETS